MPRTSNKRASISWLQWLFLTPKQRQAIKLVRSGQFYQSREWYELRYRVLRKYGGHCRLCGIRGGQKTEGGTWAIIQVDHIKPSSKWSHMALSFRNLQPMCSICNQGKSNRFQDNWLNK